MKGVVIMTKNWKIPLTLCLFITLSLLIYSVKYTYAYLTSEDDFSRTSIIGFVDIEIDVYFVKGNTTKRDNLYYVPVDGFVKEGVYYVNISNIDDIQFLENLRVDLIIKSNVDTYFRVAPYEQLTMIYLSNGVYREVAVTHMGYMPFNYNLVTPETSGFYDNRVLDGYLYYTEKVQRVNATTGLVIPLIGEYFVDQRFSPYGQRYCLQIGFIVEAVQAYLGAENNWSLAQAPWGEEW